MKSPFLPCEQWRAGCDLRGTVYVAVWREDPTSSDPLAAKYFVRCEAAPLDNTTSFGALIEDAANRAILQHRMLVAEAEPSCPECGPGAPGYVLDEDPRYDGLLGGPPSKHACPTCAGWTA